MILFVGQVERGNRGRDAFQELDYRAVFGSMTKWVAEIDEPDRMAEMSAALFPPPWRDARARWCWRCRMTCCRQGELPAMRLYRSAGNRAGRRPRWRRWKTCWRSAERPLLILGGGRWNEEACAPDRPFCRTFRHAGHDLLSPRPLVRSAASQLCRRSGPGAPIRNWWRGSRASDLVIAAGARLNETTSQGYTLFDIPVPQTEAGACLSRRRGTGPGLSPASGHPCLAAAVSPPRWTRCRRAAPAPGRTRRAPRITTISPGRKRRCRSRAPSISAQIMIWLREHLPDDAILCNGAGNYAGLDPPLLSLPPFRHPDRADLRLHGLWRAGRGGDESAVSRRAKWSRSMATAIS